MTPEEAKALAAKISGVVGEAAAPSISQADAFRQRIVGSPAGVAAVDRGEHLLGTLAGATRAVSPAVVAGDYAASAAMKAAGIKDGRPSRGPGGPDDLSRAAQLQLRKDDTSELLPMRAADVDVQAAPTLDVQKAAAARRGGGFGIGGDGGTKAAFDAARARGLSTLDAERELTGELGVDRAGKVLGVADLQESEAARQQRNAEDQQRIDEAAAAKHDAFMNRSLELSDELAKSKIDPGRLLRSADAKTQFSVGIGAVLGGILSGMNGGPNTSLERLDRIIDKDIRAQEQEIDSKKAQLSARDSIFGKMLQESGDRRLAKQQTRLMMLESAKLKIQADSDRLGIPEVRTNAALAANQIQQKIDAARAAMAKEAYDAYRQQAAAAAAAQRAAEQQAWQRSMDVAKLGLERDKMEIEKMKAAGLTGEDIQKQTQSLSKELSDKDLAEGRGAVESLKASLRGRKDDEGIAGIGRMGDIREKLRPDGLMSLMPAAHLANAVAGLSDNERVNRSNWEKLQASYIKQISGSGVSESERQNLIKAFAGAKTAAEQRNAIAMADDVFSRRESTIRAGYDPKAVAIFESRLKGERPEMPSSVRKK